MSKRTLAIIIPGTKHKSPLPPRILATLSCSQEGFWGYLFLKIVPLSAALHFALELNFKRDICKRSSSAIRMNQPQSLRRHTEKTVWTENSLAQLAFYIKAFQETIRFPPADLNVEHRRPRVAFGISYRSAAEADLPSCFICLGGRSSVSGWCVQRSGRKEGSDIFLCFFFLVLSGSQRLKIQHKRPRVLGSHTVKAALIRERPRKSFMTKQSYF